MFLPFFLVDSLLFFSTGSVAIYLVMRFRTRIDGWDRHGAYADEWVEIDVTFEEGTKRDWSLSETDIVLLKRPDNPMVFLAKIHHFKAPRNAPLQATIRMVAGQSGPGPQIDSRWVLSKVFR